MFIALFLTLARAYETDQLTDRLLPLADATPRANAWADQLLASAVERTNADTRCRQDEEQTRRVLGRHIATATAKAQFVPERDLAGFGYGVYSALMETGDIPRHSFTSRDDIYGSLRPGESVVLASVGTASTVRLGGQLIGTDKTDHFWGVGFEYVNVSNWGKKEARAMRWGTFSEKAFYGLLTSNVFSYADLASNEDGYRFYITLLTPGSMFQRGPDGCVYQARPFDWHEWIDEEWDEVLNPSVYNKYVQAAVHERLLARRGDYCASYLQWRDDYLPKLAAVLQERPAYASPRAPRHVDVYRLEELCADYITAGLQQGITHTPGPVDTSLLTDNLNDAHRVRAPR